MESGPQVSAAHLAIEVAFVLAGVVAIWAVVRSLRTAP